MVEECHLPDGLAGPDPSHVLAGDDDVGVALDDEERLGADGAFTYQHLPGLAQDVLGRVVG